MTSPRGRAWRVATVWLVVAFGAILFRSGSDAPAWAGWIPATVAYWADTSVLASMGGAVLSAWLVLPLRTRRGGEWVQIGARTRGELVRSAILVPGLATTAGATLALLAMVGYSVAMGGDPRVAWPQAVLWWAGTVVAINAFSVIGGLLAWWMKSPVVLVVAPALVYLLVLLPLYTLTPPPWSALYAVVAESWTEMTPTVLSTTARAGLWLGLAVAGGALLAGQRKAAWVALMVSSLSLTVGLFDAPGRSQIPEAPQVVCIEGRPAVCTRETWAAGLSQSSAIISQGYALLPDDLVPAVIGSDSGAGPRGITPAEVFQVEGGVSAPTNLPDRSSTLAALGDHVLIGNCSEVGDAQQILLIWWRQALNLPLDESVRAGDFVPQKQLTPADFEPFLARAETFGELPAGVRSRWFTTHASQIRDCSLSVADLP